MYRDGGLLAPGGRQMTREELLLNQVSPFLAEQVLLLVSQWNEW